MNFNKKEVNCSNPLASYAAFIILIRHRTCIPCKCTGLHSYHVKKIETPFRDPKFRIEKFPENTVMGCDPVDRIFHDFSKHPSILKIKNTTTPLETFSFKINDMHMRKEILASNTKKSAGHDSILPKIVKKLSLF